MSKCRNNKNNYCLRFSPFTINTWLARFIHQKWQQTSTQQCWTKFSPNHSTIIFYYCSAKHVTCSWVINLTSITWNRRVTNPFVFLGIIIGNPAVSVWNISHKLIYKRLKDSSNATKSLSLHWLLPTEHNLNKRFAPMVLIPAKRV